MATIVDVPLNTMLADLDESLRALLKEQLERHGFDGVEIAFDAPSREWSGQLSSPTVNCFLYDIRRSSDFQPSEFDVQRLEGGRAIMRRPPLMIECSYAVSAWTQAVEDEHRLLSQVLAVLHSFPELPQSALHGRLSNGSQRYPIEAKIGLPKGEGKADFWSSVGGQYKASLDYVVTLGLEAGVAHERGPEVRTTTFRFADDAPTRTALELHRARGRVRAKDGAGIADAWVALPGLGRLASTDPQGNFNLERVPPGTHACVARLADGTELKGKLEVPGAGVELVAKR